MPATARLAGMFGGVFVGERGWVTSMTTGGPIEGGPETLFDEMKLHDARGRTPAATTITRTGSSASARGRAPAADEEIGHRSASLGHLAIIAYKLQRSLKWDPAKEEFLGDDEANRLCRRAMREPWRM